MEKTDTPKREESIWIMAQVDGDPQTQRKKKNMK